MIKFIIILCLCVATAYGEQNMMTWKLNTSNPGKFEEFKRLFNQHGIELETSHQDLREIVSDPVSVVVHKASQFGDHVVVEDTSLDVEGADVGVNVKWLLDHLPEYKGHKATWTVLLAYREGDKVYVFKGQVFGTIVEPKGAKGFGFDPVFLPSGSKQTLAESKPDHVNARALAVEALVKQRTFEIRPAMQEWEGPWQH